MTREDIVKQVNKVLAEEFETEESKMTPDANLRPCGCYSVYLQAEGACGGSPQDQHLQ